MLDDGTDKSVNRLTSISRDVMDEEVDEPLSLNINVMEHRKSDITD